MNTEGTGLARKYHKPEEIIAKLRQAEVLVGQGKPVAEGIRAIGMKEPTYYRWRVEYAGLRLDQMRRLKVLEQDNGPEFMALAVKGWITGVGAKTADIEPGSSWENGHVESFNGKLRDELLDMEVFNALLEAKVLIEHWRVHYNTVRPHSSLGYRPPAPEVILSCMPMPPGNPEPTGSPPPPATMLH